MAFIDTTPPEAVEGALAAMYLRQQHAWGFVPNYAKVFCHRPEVLARWGQLLTEIRRPMDKRRFELITFVASSILPKPINAFRYVSMTPRSSDDAPAASLSIGAALA